MHYCRCPVSGVDYPGLLNVPRVLSWGENPMYRADLTNVLTLGETRHVAFDCGLFHDRQGLSVVRESVVRDGNRVVAGKDFRGGLW